MISTSMQQRAGLLFLSKKTARILLILEQSKWTVPTFERSKTLFEDVENLLIRYQKGKIVPLELYLSEDKGFEYSTYICLVDNEFFAENTKTYAWVCLDHQPMNLHNGLKQTLSSPIIRTKIETVLELENVKFSS